MIFCGRGGVLYPVCIAWEEDGWIRAEWGARIRPGTVLLAAAKGRKRYANVKKKAWRG